MFSLDKLLIRSFRWRLSLRFALEKLKGVLRAGLLGSSDIVMLYTQWGSLPAKQPTICTRILRG